MELDSAQENHVVHPEVRAYIYSLVTALGGAGISETGKYVLGDDALAVLRDIRKWLKFYDERMNRMDVARCLAEAALVNNDLVPILAQWGEKAQESKHFSRITLACLELLVPLTWPLQTSAEMTVNHARHTPYLQQAQVTYKWGILSNTTAPILRAIIRIALPSISTDAADRSSRDEGILKLMLYFFRNIAIIDNYQDDGEGQTSRSATITAFQEQDVFALILTMCSNIDSQFAHQDIVILDVLFHLLKGIDPRKVFNDKVQRQQQHTSELEDLLKQEADINRSYARNAPTRHGRFGTMIWVKRDEAKFSTVSGQDVLKDSRATFLKMDESKKFNRPRGRRSKEDVSINNFTRPCKLTSTASDHLRTFVEEFIDSSFNPLFIHVRGAIEREADRVTEYTKCQFFYLIAWFLQAERLRRARQNEAHQQQNKDQWRQIDPDSFAIVAGVLNQETFIALHRHMRESLDRKDWRDVNATIRCFSQILLTVQDMSISPLEEDQEIAENIQNRIFYEEETHERVLKIIREYKDQGFNYLDACTELSHVFLKMLERYSKTNVHMQVRSRRAKRRKQKQQQRKASDTNDAEADQAELDSEEEEVAEAQALVVERAFDFKRFAARFTTQKSVDTFATFLSYYRELDWEQLKRAHRFFYRVAFKQELAVLLFRVDIIALFYKMIKGPQNLDHTHPGFTEWEELIRHVLRKMTKRLKQRPELFVEMLFSKINSTLYVLENGYERPAIKSQPRQAAELEVKPGVAPDAATRLGIVISALLLEEKRTEVEWLAQTLQSVLDQRKRWEDETKQQAQNTEKENIDHRKCPSYTIIPYNESCRMEMITNGQLKLLLSLIGASKLSIEEDEDADADSSWIIPSSIETSKVEEDLSAFNKYLKSPLTEIDGKDPRDLLRRKPKTKGASASTSYGVNFGDDSEGEDEILFPANPRQRSNGAAKKKPSGRSRRNLTEELDEETLEKRRQERRAAALARQRKIKSDLFMHYSDDDDEADREFFAQEEKRRREQAMSVRRAAMLADVQQKADARASTRKRPRKEKDTDADGMTTDGSGMSNDDSLDLDGINDDDEDEEQPRSRAKRQRARIVSDSEDDEMPDVQGSVPIHDLTD